MSTASIASILAESAYRYPDKTAVVMGETRISYAALWDQARRFAAVLQAQGVEPGDRVALNIPNTPHFPMAAYGAWAAGASVVPVNVLLTADEIAYILSDSEAKLIIAAAPLLSETLKAAEGTQTQVLAVMDTGDNQVPRIDQLAAQTEPITHVVPREITSEGMILYTSGTTGKPKGAMITVSNTVMNNNVSTFDTIQLQHDDVFLGVLPLFHSFGLNVVMSSCFRVGATMVLLPRFEGPAAMDTIVKEQVTVFAGVPTMFVGLLEEAKKDSRRPQLRLAVSGGAPLPGAVIEKVKEVFGVDIMEGYGLSETSPVATFNQARFGTQAGTVGHAIWGVDVEIADSANEKEIKILGPNEVGEIVIRGHNVFSGYLNKPEASAEVLVDGWFRSGDIGTKDEKGFVRITDRKKEMIIRGGFNVYPRELEEVLAKYPGVSSVAVVGLPDEKYGEEISAVVVPESGVELDGEEIKSWSKDRLGAYKYPRSVQVVPALPLGPTGKILKREIKLKLTEGEPLV